MRHAFIILAHGELGVFARLLDYLDNASCDLYMNIDRKAQLGAFSALLQKHPNIRYVGHDKVNWGGFSILRTELKMLAFAIGENRADYFHILSGQDYPVRPIQEFLRFFEQQEPKSYFSCLPASYEDIDRRLFYFLPYDHFQVRSVRGQKVSRWIRVFLKKHQIKRNTRFFPEVIHLGSQWCSLTKDACAFLLDYTRTNPQFFKRLNNTFAPEEIYIHTILINFYKAESVETTNNLRFIRWELENGNRPANLGPEHLKFLCAGNTFFARKMTESVSLPLMNQIDEHLIGNYEKNKRYFNFNPNTAECIVDVFRALSIESVLVIGDSLLYVDALLGKGIAANGLVQTRQAMEWARLFNIEDYCQFADRGEPLEVDDDDLYDILLLVNQLAGLSSGDLAAELFRLSALTSRYVMVVETASEGGFTKTLEQAITGSDFIMVSAMNELLTSRLKDERSEARPYLLIKKTSL